MHELFANLLSKRDPLDLSRAGDLFSIPDEEIVDDLTDVVRKITNVIFLILCYTNVFIPYFSCWKFQQSFHSLDI